MVELSVPFFTILSLVLAVALTSVGVGIGESLTSIAALKAINIQPKASNDINKLSILGMALTETSAVLALVIAIMLIISKPTSLNYYADLSRLGIAFAISFSGTAIGMASSLPAKAACLAVARQPFFANKILNIMLLTIAFIQTPVIFGFIISFFINYQANDCTTLGEALRVIASGISIGLGSIGPTLGLAYFAKSACEGLGINRDSYEKVMTFTFVSEALIETPVVFSLVTALLILTSSAPTTLHGLAFLASGLCVGIGNSAPGISSGQTAASACEQIAIKPELYSVLSKTSVLAQGLIDSMTIYCWIVSLILIFFAG